MSDAPTKRRQRRDQLDRLRAYVEAAETRRPGDVIGLPTGMTARWLDLADGPGRAAELRAFYESMGFERAEGLSVVGVAQAEVWTAPAEAERILLESRIARARARANERARSREAAAQEALIEDLAARMAARQQQE